MTSDVAGSHLPESLYGPCGCLRYREGKQAHPVLKYRVPHGSHTPTRWVAGRLYLSILPEGTRDTLTETHTHGFGLVAICGIQRYFGGSGRCPEGHPPRHRRQLPRARLQHLQGLAPRHQPTDRRQTCLYVVHRCQGRPTLNRLGCWRRVLHHSRPAPKVDGEDARAGRPSPHQKSAFLHHLGRQH